jgi:hypothetical protein
VQALIEDKSDGRKESFYEELECVFSQFPLYHMKVVFGGFSAKVGREDIFSLTIWNDS